MAICVNPEKTSSRVFLRLGVAAVVFVFAVSGPAPDLRCDALKQQPEVLDL
jgi:hypothetical protein